MKSTKGFNDILVYLVIASLFSMVFIATYAFVDYQRYLRAYQMAHVLEKTEAKRKINAHLKNLKKLLTLTGVRIQSAQGNVKRIQDILSSLYQLQPTQKLPEFQRVFFYQFSPPQLMTRFGKLPFDPAKISLENMSSREPSAVLVKKNILGRLLILNDMNSSQGILEIHINFSAFKQLLGAYKTIDFEPTSTSKDFKIIPSEEKIFSFLDKKPNNFWLYTFNQKNQYLVFTFYVIFSTLLIGLFLYYLNVQLQKTYKETLKRLKGIASNLTKERDALKTEVSKHQGDIEIHQTSFQAYKKFSTSLNKRQEGQATYIVRSLDVLEQSLRNPRTQLSNTDQIEIIYSCLESARSISTISWDQRKNAPIQVMEMLEEIQVFFSEKIHKSSIILKATCPENLTFMGDPLFTRIILMNIIGKSIHRVPKQGEVLVLFSGTPTSFQIEVCDNGYLLAGASENLIKKSFDFFISDNRFNQICKENKLIYDASKDQNNLNITKISFPLHQHHYEASHKNVVKLFK